MLSLRLCHLFVLDFIIIAINFFPSVKTMQIMNDVFVGDGTDTYFSATDLSLSFFIFLYLFLEAVTFAKLPLFSFNLPRFIFSMLTTLLEKLRNYIISISHHLFTNIVVSRWMKPMPSLIAVALLAMRVIYAIDALRIIASVTIKNWSSLFVWR